MHYIPSHTAEFSDREEAIFKKTLKIRVATKRAATCQHETALFPLQEILLLFFIPTDRLFRPMLPCKAWQIH